MPKSKISYHLPILGTTEIVLHDESAKFYRSLSKSGEIKRLSNVPQLGAVSSAWQGARHNKWEYILTTLTLIDSCKNHSNFKLGSGVKLIGNDRISSITELLNSWALLLQVGHLHWTFASERILFDQISHNEKYIDELIAKASNEDVKKWMRDIIGSKSYYKYHQILAYYRLKKVIDSNDLVKYGKSVLDSYILAERRKGLREAKKLFIKIRRVAYLSLDAEFSPTVAGIKLGKIVRGHKELERLINLSENEVDEISSIESHLVKSVYLGEEVFNKIARKSKDINKRLEKCLSQTLKHGIESLTNGGIVNSAIEDQDIYTIVRSSFHRTFFWDKDGLSFAKQSDRVNQWNKSNNVDLILSYGEDRITKRKILQLDGKGGIAEKSSGIAYVVNLVFELIKNNELYFENIRFILEQHFLLSEVLDNLLITILETIFKVDLRWEFSDKLSNSNVLVIPNKIKQRAVSRLTKLNGITKSKAHEVLCTFESIKGLNCDYSIIMVSNISGFDKEKGIRKIEIDGIAFSLNEFKKELVITLSEAKKQQKASESSSRKALIEKSKKINREKGVSMGRVQSKTINGGAYAYRHFRVKYSK